MTTDISFITNEPGKSLLNRFGDLIKDSETFDCLVGYFYASGFRAMYPHLENTNKIRILVGMRADELIIKAIKKNMNQGQLDYEGKAPTQIRKQISAFVEKEMEETLDEQTTEDGLRKFLEWLKNGKLEIRACPEKNIHAKVYIMTFKKGDRDIGRVITGSSNFSIGGLNENLEFNVELKNSGDYDYAKNKFEELWKKGTDVGEEYQDTLLKRSWLRDNILPYELYLKFLYEYFKDELNQIDIPFMNAEYLPENFMKLRYQQQAVLNAKKTLLEYGGVFISDVVGLGKTYIAANARQAIGWQKPGDCPADAFKIFQHRILAKDILRL